MNKRRRHKAKRRRLQLRIARRFCDRIAALQRATLSAPHIVAAEILFCEGMLRPRVWRGFYGRSA